MIPDGAIVAHHQLLSYASALGQSGVHLTVDLSTRFPADTAPAFISVAAFTNLTFDWVCPEDLREQIPVIAGEEMPFRYGDLQLGQGKEKARLYLKENPKITEEIKEKIMAAGGHIGNLSKSAGDEDDEPAGNIEE